MPHLTLVDMSKQPSFETVICPIRRKSLAAILISSLAEQIGQLAGVVVAQKRQL